MRHSANLGALPIFLAIFLFASSPATPAWGADTGHGFHTIRVSPEMKGKISKETLADVTRFFEDAEDAIKTGNLESLMNLYSDSYKNGDHDKDAARRIWERIFSNFDGMSTMHNMKLVNYSPDGGLVVIGCSGILLGKRKGEADRVPVDTWTNEEHILTLEKGKWKLVGSAGTKRKRLWFDRPMHPLF
ncbi:MAG: nuclear transport factor 2 family protein [Nitrospinota bacterium]|nr:nuclear transport factor 2 family protein [Nitrospinota bacterium]